jgi:hypothetical protein
MKPLPRDDSLWVMLSLIWLALLLTVVLFGFGIL